MDELEISELFKALKDGKATLLNKTTGDRAELTCEFSERQQKMLLAGGLLKYTKGN